MKHAYKVLLTAAGSLISASTSWADTLPTHRIPAALAVEAANETVAACARQGYRETAVVLDADGAMIAALRGDGAAIYTLDSAHDKAYTAVSFKNDTLALAERAKGEESVAHRTSCSSVAAWRSSLARSSAPSVRAARPEPNLTMVARTPGSTRSAIS